MERKNEDKFKAWRAAVLADAWQRARKILAETPEDEDDKAEDEREERQEREERALYEEEWEKEWEEVKGEQEGEEGERERYPILMSAEKAARKETRRLKKIERHLPCGHDASLAQIMKAFEQFAKDGLAVPSCEASDGCGREYLEFPMAPPSKTGFFLVVLVIGEELNYNPRRLMFFAEPFHTLDEVRRNLHWHEDRYKDWYNIRFYGPNYHAELDNPNQTLEKAGINESNSLVAYRTPLDPSKPGYTVPVKEEQSRAFVEPF